MPSVTQNPADPEVSISLNPLSQTAEAGQAFGLTGWTKNALSFFIILLVVLAVAEGFARLVVHLAQPPLSYSSTFDDKFAIAQQESAQTEPAIYIMGDSLASLGVYPELLELKLNEDLPAAGHVRVRNLAVPNSHPRMQAALLNHLLTQPSPPKINGILLNVAPRTFSSRFEAPHPLYNPDESSLEHSYTGRCLLKQPKTFWAGVDCALSQHLYLARYRSFLKQTLTRLDRIVLKPDERLDEKNQYLTSDYGWTPRPRIETATVRKQVETAQQNTLQTFSRFQKNEHWSTASLDAFVTLCKQHHIPLTLVWLPEHPRRHENGKPGDEQAIEAKMAAYAKQHGLPFYAYENKLVGEAYYSDVQHLNAYGAIEFTNTLLPLLSPWTP